MAETSDVRAERLAKNEVLFRSVNENIAGMERRSRLDAGFICECSQLQCSEIIPISVEEWELIHQDRSKFVLVPGHEEAEIERILSQPDGYLVVEKIGPGKPIAEEGRL
jgi:hypothetical protein